MSDNDIQSIEDELSQRKSTLTQNEIEDLSATIKKPNKKRKFKQLLDGEYPHKSNQEMSLAGMVMWRTGDAELAARIVACSDTTEKSNWSETEIEEKRRKITQWDALNQWSRGYSKNDNDDDDDDGGASPEPTPQNVQSGNGKFKSGYDKRAEETMNDVFGL